MNRCHKVLLLALLLMGRVAAADDKAVTEPAVVLQGIVLRQALQGFDPAGAGDQGLNLSASAVAMADESFRARAGAMLGQPVSLDLLQDLTTEVVLAYRRAGRPLADAAVPEQNISNGTVQVIVLEAHLGTVSVEGAKHFSAERIRAALRSHPGEPLVAGSLFSDLDWLNQNPFRRVDLVYERGRDLSTTDVVLRVTDRRPWVVFTGYDNDNLDALGRDRWIAGVRAGNLWGREHQLGFLYAQGRQAEVYRGLALDYTVPLRWRHSLAVSASLAEPSLRGSVFDSRGRSARLSLRYGGNLPRTRIWQFGWTAGYEARSNDNDILFGGTNVFSARYRTHEFVGEFSARRPGPAGDTFLKASWHFSPGDLGEGNSSAELSGAGRGGINARYSYGELSGSQAVALPRDFSLLVSARLRLSEARLPASSQYTLGGMSQLPGYSETTALGDAAAWAQLRLRSPAIRAWGKPGEAHPDALRLFTTYSWGRATLNDLTVAEANQGLTAQRKLESLAIGLTYEYTRRLQFNFAYGWQLRSPAAGVDRAGRGHVSVVLDF